MEEIKELKNKTIRGILADFSFDEYGILHAVSKEGNRSIETLIEDLLTVKKMVGNTKVCMIIDNSFTKAYDFEMIQYTIKEYPKLFNAVAFIPNTPIGKMISSILATLNPGNSIPIEMFENKIVAEKWIKQYL